MGDGTLYFTANMGSTWSAATMPPYFSGRSIEELVTDVAALGQSDLWVGVGDVIGAVPLTQSINGSVREDGVIRSTDGGTTWSFVELPGCLQSCSGISLSFVDALHGFATGGSSQSAQTTLFATGDGGITWQPVSLLPDDADGAQITFTSLEDGWAVTDPNDFSEELAAAGNSLLHTTNGGLTWQTIPGLPHDSLYGLPTFFGTEDGVVLRYGPTPTVFTTSDGGVTWEPHALPLSEHVPVATHGEYQLVAPLSEYQPIPFSAPTVTTWFALAPTGLVETTDAGAHWQRVTTQIASDTDTSQQSLLFFSKTNGWALNPPPGCLSGGCETELLGTNDGGRKWTAIAP